MLYDMYNKSISARESNVDLAIGISERKPALLVIASAATASKCSRQWYASMLEPAFQKKNEFSVFMVMMTMYFVWCLHDCLFSIVAICH